MTDIVICNRCCRLDFASRYADRVSLLEISLWCLGVIPGLCYSAHKRMTWHYGCSGCRSTRLTDVRSPAGLALLAERKPSPELMRIVRKKGSEPLFVAVSDKSGGKCTPAQIRQRLDRGDLHPSDICFVAGSPPTWFSAAEFRQL